MDKFILLLFPIIFMIHEFEEIIMIEKWMNKNRSDFDRRFPRIAQRMNKFMDIDTRNFSIIVAEEFFIVSILTITSVLTNNIIYWYCILTAFSIHLIIHFLQFVIWKKYIPAIITTILCIAYCIFAIEKASYILTFKELFIYAVVGIIIGAVNLLVMHRFAFNWYKKGQ